MQRAVSATSFAALGLTTALLGCLPSHYQSSDGRKSYPPPMFEDYVAHIQARSDVWPVAKIPPSLQFTAPLALENPFGFEGKLASLDASKICLEFKSVGEPSSRPGDDIAKGHLSWLNENQVAISALPSLSAEKGRPLIQTPDGATRFDASTLITDEVRDFDNRDRGTVERRRVAISHVCAPAPAITSATKFIALTFVLADPGKPDYTTRVAVDDADRASIELHNQEERLKAGALVLIAITDGAVDLRQ